MSLKNYLSDETLSFLRWFSYCWPFSIYDFEYAAYKHVMAFEKEFHKRFGVWKSGKPAPGDIKAMIKNELPVMVYQKLKKNEDESMDSIV